MRLQRGVIRLGRRAYALNGVTAEVQAAASVGDSAPGTANGVIALLRRMAGGRSRRSPVVTLMIAGPGFRWQVAVDPRREADASSFARQVNRAAQQVTA